MCGSQPLAAVSAGASCLAVECQPIRIEMLLRTGYLDVAAHTIEEAMAVIDQSCAERKPVSVGLLGNAAEILPELYRRGVRPDLLTDQTSAPARKSVVEGKSVSGRVDPGGCRSIKNKSDKQNPNTAQHTSRIAT